MLDSLYNIFGLAALVFLFPYIVLGTIVRILRERILRHKLAPVEEGFTRPMFVKAALLWVVIGGYYFYQSQYKVIEYAYVCPDSTQVKCYHLPVDTFKDEGYFGISRAYFPNGGYITFDYCEKDSSVQYDCWSDSEDKFWRIEMSNVKKKVKR